MDSWWIYPEMLLTITNLYPRPDEPDRGLFNMQLFERLSRRLGREEPRPGEAGTMGGGMTNVCLVPSWKLWSWSTIRAWQSPHGSSHTTRYLPVFYLPVIGRNLSWATYRFALRRLAGQARTCRAVLATWLYPDAVAAADLARVSGRPLWIKLHGGDIRHLNGRSRRTHILRACEQASGIVCVSHPLMAQLERAGVDAAKIHHVPNGVDTEIFQCDGVGILPAHLTNRIRTIAGQPVSPGKRVLYVGHLTRIKGPDFLVEAWKVLRDMTRREEGGSATMPGPTLLIIGEGPWRNRLEKRVRRLGLENTVAFIGVRPHEEIAQWMRAADCLCLPSRSEGMPNVVLESLACGTPVVATNVGAVPTMISEGETGYIVDRAQRDFVSNLAHSLRVALDGSWDRDAIAATVRLRTWERAADQIASLILGQGMESLDRR